MLTEIKKYYSSKIHKPFFAVVGNNEYKNLKTNLEELGVNFIGLSEYCSQDKHPDLDKLREKLAGAGTNKVVVLGLGEYLLLRGDSDAKNILKEFKNYNLRSAQAVFLLRGMQEFINNIALEDPRFNKQRYGISPNANNAEFNISISSMEISLYEICGIKGLISEFEKGEKENINCNSDKQFPNAKCNVEIIKDSYEAIKHLDSCFKIAKSKGSKEQWDYLLKQVKEYKTIANVFNALKFSKDIENDFYSKISGDTNKCWLYYIYLLTIKSCIKMGYLTYCLEESRDFEDFKYKILNSIIDIAHDDSRFNDYYSQRKKIVRDFPEAEIAKFVVNNRKNNTPKSLYKLTDNTNVERQEIIAYISKDKLLPDLDRIYPDLNMYLKKYYFRDNVLSEELTEYFEEYKKQKILDKIDKSFLKKVNEYALSRKYNLLETRDEIVLNYANQKAFLCYIDSLGVEYLSFIVEQSKKRGLIASVKIARSNLPTITSKNNQFFLDWPQDARIKIEELDEVKHKEKGGYKYGTNKYPIHLARELEIISDVIDIAATELALHNYEKYIIASDHGASRLAVIRNKEEKYDTDTKGEHSGRCCKLFENYELPFATEENGFVVLADYGRFKGSRAANVEVHGGASLEEVIVPVIELSLADSKLEISLVNKDIVSDFKTGALINLYVNKELSQELIVQIEGQGYKANKVDKNYYEVKIEQMKRAKKYDADIYVGEKLISKIEITTRGKSASMNSDFDELF